MNSQYSTLFSVALQHEYFQNRRCLDFEISPSADCLVHLRRMHIQWRSFENRYYAFIEENSRQEPVLNGASAKYFRNDYSKTVLRFYLKLKNPLLLNYTNIDPSYGRGKKFYFSNTANNADNGTCYLSAPVPPFANDKPYFPGNLAKDARTGTVYEALKKYTSKKKTDLTDPALWSAKGLQNPGSPIAEYKAGKAYQPGDLVKAASGDLFEAVRRHTGNSAKDLENRALWSARGQGQLQYATDNDLIFCCGSKCILPVPEPVKKADVAVLGYNFNAASPAYDLPARESGSQTFSSPVASVPVDLSGLPPGKYAIRINKETTYIYYDPAVEFSTLFGVIEIYNHLPGQDAYAFLTDEEQIKTADYQLLFPVRRVLWKYIRKDGRADAITDTGDTGYQFSLKGDEFISSVPMPFSESPLKTLRLDFNTHDFRLFPLPNPSVERLRKCVQDEYEYLCSEVNLNY
ncbi:MAG: hypothetical protein INR73_03355 [Williamsia sp.]|nr:hypothetical protein [Williamsia sp.]